MREILFILFSIISTFHLFSQTYDTIFYDSDDNQANNQDYSYYQIISKRDSLNYNVIENFKGDSLKAKYILKSFVELEVDDDNLYRLIKRNGFIKVDTATIDSQSYTMKYPNESKICDSLSFKEDEPVYQFADNMPNFNGGGLNDFRTYVAKTLRYPEISAKYRIQGRVFVQFIVDRNGHVQNAEIIRGVDPSLDREALRVIKSSPRWEPGSKDGEKVSVMFTMPIIFVLD